MEQLFLLLQQIYRDLSILSTYPPEEREESVGIQRWLVVCLACAFYWSSLRDCTSGLVAGSHDSEEHA